MPPKSITLEFFHLGPRPAPPAGGGPGAARSNGSHSTLTSSSALSLRPPSDHVSTSQYPLRERILGQRDTRLFVDHKQRVMQIAFDSHSGVSVETMEFTLFCPYSQTRMQVPVRSDSCCHVQCCDLDSWVSLFAKFKAMRDPGAPCPVCDNRVLLSSLMVDEWMVTVLRNVSTRMVILERSGAYRSGDAARAAKRLREEEEIVGTQMTPPTEDDGVDANCETYDGRPTSGHLGGGMPTIKMEPRSSVDRRSVDRLAHGDAALEEEDDQMPSSTSPAVIRAGADAFGMLGAQGCARLGTERQQLQTRQESNCRLTDGKVTVDGSSANVSEQSDGSAVRVKGQPSLLASTTSSGKSRPPQPAGWRKWMPYCPACLVPCVASLSGANNADSTGGVQYDGDDAEFVCRDCRATRRRFDWPAMRTFGAAGDAAVATTPHRGGTQTSIEVTEDGTVVLRGVDPMSKFLFKGGFWRTSLAIVGAECRRAATQYEPVAAAANDHRGDDSATSVWFTSSKLSKMELDFLETMCEEISRGNDPYEFVGFAPTLFKFRYEKNNSFNRDRSGGTLFTQHTPPPAAAMVSPPSASDPSAAASPVGTRPGSFRIQFQFGQAAR